MSSSVLERPSDIMVRQQRGGEEEEDDEEGDDNGRFLRLENLLGFTVAGADDDEAKRSWVFIDDQDVKERCEYYVASHWPTLWYSIAPLILLFLLRCRLLRQVWIHSV